jgi:3-methyladenine DNA glycosylase AlkC
LALLNAGAAEARTLAECLAIDFAILARAVAPDIGEDALDQVQQLSSAGISKRMKVMGQLCMDRLGTAAIARFKAHPSDTVRGWACFMVGAQSGLTTRERLAAIRDFADDPHFGVREWAWMAVRESLAADLAQSMALLCEWTTESSERLRRFASEALRPRGVWCSHLQVLKEQPELALPILEALRADPSAYVQDSVGNWLNDASKDQPDWVRALCVCWKRESPTPATIRVCKRGTRTIAKKLSV